MTRSAPIELTSSTFRALQTAVTSALSGLAIRTAKVPTPPVRAGHRRRAACYASIAFAEPRRSAGRVTYETASNPINATGNKNKAPSPAR